MLLWLDIVIMLSETSGMVYFLTSAVLFLWFSLLDEAERQNRVIVMKMAFFNVNPVRPPVVH